MKPRKNVTRILCPVLCMGFRMVLDQLLSGSSETTFLIQSDVIDIKILQEDEII